MSEGKRGLAAIMFTDMVGYTALGQRNESLSLALVEEQKKLIRPILIRHNGREVKTIGDAFLVEFPNALDATMCAYDIQRATREFNFAIVEDRRLHLRIGIHLGDVVELDGDISGDAVNVASRIEPLSEDGGVCLTREVYAQVSNKFGLHLTSLGQKSLKNVNTPIEVFKMQMPWEHEGGGAPISFDRKRIAVLPFANISPDASDEYFADGMTEELITTMSKISGLKVIARTSVSRYKEGSKGVKEIAGELEVGSVLEGSVRKAGDSVRIAVQLIDPQSNEHLWAESYDRELIDVLAIQADISRTVAETLKVKLLSKEDVAIGRKQTVDPEGYTLYLKGRYYWNERTKESVNKAMKYFEWAIQVDLAFASAYSGLADCYSMFGSALWMAPAKAYPQAWEFGKKALEIDDNLAEAHASRGYVLMVYFWDFDTAEREFKRAMELSPNYATAYLWHSYMMFFLQDYEKAYLQGKRALELDPLSRGTNMYLATYLASLGKTDEAMEKYEKTIQMNPDFAAVHYWKSLVHSWLSEHDAAIEEARRAFDLENSPLVEQWLASACARAGKKDEAQGILDRLRTKETGEYVSPVWNGMLEISLGRTDEGYRLLERSLADRNQALLFFRGMPWFKEYRLDPRWNKIEERLNLPKRASPL